VPTFNGLDRYDATESRFKHFQHYPGNPTGLSDNSVQAFVSDKEGMIWIGTRGGGLNRFDPATKTFTHYLHDSDDPDSLSNNSTLDLAMDQDGILWIGTSVGIDRFDPREKKFKHYKHKPNDPGTLTHGEIRSVDFDQKGSLWIGSYGGGLDRFDPVSQKFTHFMPEQDNPNSLVSEWIFVVFVDSSGKIWVGTEGGLGCLDPEKEIFTNYVTGKMDFNTRAIYQDRQGTIWIGTNGGLKRFNQESQTFTEYNTNEGLAGSIAAGIIEDDQGFLWIGTNNGLSKFDPQKKTFRNYDAGDGLQSNQFRRNAVYKSPEGELYFGGVNGFNSFFPENITENPNIPPVVLTDFQLFNQPVGIGGDSPLQQHISVAEQITFSHDQSVFSIEFAALNYRNSAKNQYAYMMEGFDENWIFVETAEPRANYTNLDPGEYIFRVKGSNNDGLWNEQGASIDILILPPWWETSWFYSLMALLGLAIVFAVIFYVAKLRKEITERKRAEKKLRTKERVFDTSISAISIADLKGVFTEINPAFLQTWGFSNKDEVLGKKISYFIQNQEEAAEIVKALNKAGVWKGDFIAKKKDGSTFIAQSYATILQDNNGEIVGYQSSVRDITEHKQAEEEMERIFNMTNYMVCVASLDGYFTRVNASFEQILGYSSKDLLSKPFFDFIHPDDVEKTKAVVEEKLSSGVKVIAFENRYRCKDGSYKWLSWTSQPVPEENATYAIAFDITDRKQAEDKLKDSEKRSWAYLKNSPACTKIVDLDFNLQFMSRAGVEGLNVDDVTELYGKPYPFAFYPESFRNLMIGNLEKVRETGEIIEQEGSVVDVDGSELWFHSTLVPVNDDHGKIDYIMVVSINITARKKAELEILANEQQLVASNQQLLANQKEREQLFKTLEFKNRELQDIVYSASHDLRSPLVNIEGFSSILKTDCGELMKLLADVDKGQDKSDQIEELLSQDIPESLRFITGSTKKMASLLDGLLQVSRVGSVEINSIFLDMNSLTKEVLAAMEHQIQESSASITVESLPGCVGDVHMLDHVLTNLFGNAIKYLDPARKGEIKISSEVKDGMSVYCIADNGIGIAAGHQHKVFEIFHRLDPDGSVDGEGLGLTIVTRIVDRLGGRVWVESEPGKGSKFFFSLPTG
jgi:PAS domain S-box-containing protein